jgi:hypothetical protein
VTWHGVSGVRVWYILAMARWLVLCYDVRWRKKEWSRVMKKREEKRGIM